MQAEEKRKIFLEEVALNKRTMIYKLEDIISAIDNLYVKESLRKIIQDDIGHYASIMYLLDLFVIDFNMDNRLLMREHSLTKVRIKDLSSQKEFEAYGINISNKGICIELNQTLAQGHLYELWIDFHEGKESVHLFGNVKWELKLREKSYMADISYRAGMQFGSF